MVKEWEELTRGKLKRNASNNERCDLITIYKLMNNLEEADRKDLILRRKREVRNLRG